MQASTGEKLLTIPVKNIAVNRYQPRKRFDQDKIKTLSESIRTDGVLQPIVVRKSENGYELIMGERRLQAARLAGVPEIPAVVRAAADVDALRLALVENLHRENLNPIEVAEAFNALIDKFGLTHGELASLVGRDRSSVANLVRLLALPAEVRDLIATGRLGEGHGRALLALATGSEQIALARRAIKDNMTVRELEQEAGAARKRKPSKAKKPKSPQIEALENALSSHLATRVHIDERRGGKGKIVIEFYSHDDFERLAEKMNIPLPR